MSRADAVDRRPLAERWRPARLSELVGNRRAVTELARWADGWDGPGRPGSRVVLLSGPPGVGKTSAAVALASERGWALVEMNASEARNQTAIERVAGRASIAGSLDATSPEGRARRTLVLLDEADCLSGGRTTEGPRPAREPVPLRAFLEGRYGSVAALNAAWGLSAGTKSRPLETWSSVPKSPGNAAWSRLPAARKDLDEWRAAGRSEETGDRGGLATIARLVRTTRQPLVLTVNDERTLTRYSPVFRTAVRSIRFGPVEPAAVVDRLRAVAKREGIALASGAVEAIAARAQGDLRAALNDLEALSVASWKEVSAELLGTRDLASDFAGLTEEVLSRPRFYRSTEVRDRLDAPPDDLLPWIEENVPWFAPDARHREAGLAVVAAAELLLARARRWRAYGLWSYASELLTGGVALAVRDRPASDIGHAGFPRFLGEMGRSRAARAMRDAVVRKLGAHLHISRAKSRSFAVPFAEAFFSLATGGRPPPGAVETARAFASELGLTREELASLLGAEPDGGSVRAILPEPQAEELEETEALRETPASRSGPGRTARPAVQRQLGD